MASTLIDRTKDKSFLKEQMLLENSPEFLLEGLMLRISEQILSELKDKKWSYSEFATRLGVSQPYVSKLLNGKPNLTIKSLAQIASVLGYSFTDALFHKKSEDTEMFSRSKLCLLKGGGFEYDPKFAGQAG